MEIKLAQAYSFCQLGQRKNQEDARWPNTDIIDEKQRFFVVCDGVGGSEKGEVASSTVCHSIQEALSHADLSAMLFTNQDFSMVLDVAYDALDSKANRQTKDMATTMTFVCFHQGGCMMAHIGDSRIYQVRPGHGIIYRSEDHSLVNSLVHNGIITPEQAVNHPQSNVITRYMGPKETDRDRCMATVVNTKDIQKNDYFFLCSDGVLHNLSDEELVVILSSDKSNQEKNDIIASKSFSSSDNNTAILINVADVIDDSNEDEAPFEGSQTRPIKSKQYVSSEIASESHDKIGVWGWIKRQVFNIK